MIVRGYQYDDLPQILRLFHDTVHHVNCRDYTPEQVAAWAPETHDEDRWHHRLSVHDSWIALEESRIVGFTNLEKSGHLDLLFVHHAHQGRGIATALLTALEAKAREVSLTRIFTEASITARPFFEKRGFVVLQKQQVEARGVKMSNYRMEKTWS